MAILEKAISDLDGKVLPGETVFKLYDTYGFPVDLTADVARENGLTLDMDGFDKAMAVQKDQARAASQFSAVEKLDIDADAATDFIGYEDLAGEATVEAIFSVSNERLDSLEAGTEALIVLNTTPFYGESGGQIGDHGVLENEHCRFEVRDTQKQADVMVHRGELASGSLKPGDRVSARVAEPFGHPPHACGPEKSAGRSRQSEGLAGGSRSTAF